MRGHIGAYADDDLTVPAQRATPEAATDWTGRERPGRVPADNLLLEHSRALSARIWQL